MGSLFRRFALEQRAATSIEYALIASLIALAIVGAAATLGTSLKSSYQAVADSFPK